MRCSTRDPLPRRLGLALAAGMLAAAAFCQTQPPGPAPASAPASRPSVEQWRQMAVEVQAEVEKLRGWKFKAPVKIDVYGPAQLRAYIERRLFDEMYGGGRLERTEAFLRTVGLIPPACNLRQTTLDVLLNQVGGFYDPQTRTFHMLQRDAVDYGPLLNRTLIAHELTHALDDQYVDLHPLAFDPSLSEDAAIATGSVIEGSATALMTRYMMREMESGRYDAAQLAEVAAREIERAEPLRRAPPYFSALMAQYVCGMYFVFRGDLSALGGQAGEAENVLAALRDPPRSSEQILHPEKYWRAGLRDEPVLVDDAQVVALLETPGRKVLHINTVGELLCALLATDEGRELNMTAAGSPAYWTNGSASGWGGDRFFLLGELPADRSADSRSADRGGGTLPGETKGLWITAWDTPEDCDEFVEDYLRERDLPGRLVARFAPRAAVFGYGFAQDEFDGLIARLKGASLRFRQGGAVWSPGQAAGA